MINGVVCCSVRSVFTTHDLVIGWQSNHNLSRRFLRPEKQLPKCWLCRTCYPIDPVVQDNQRQGHCILTLLLCPPSVSGEPTV